MPCASSANPPSNIFGLLHHILSFYCTLTWTLPWNRRMSASSIYILAMMLWASAFPHVSVFCDFCSKFYFGKQSLTLKVRILLFNWAVNAFWGFNHMLNAGSNGIILFQTCLICKFRAVGNCSWSFTLFSAFFLCLLVLHVSPFALHVFPEFIPQAFSIPLSQVIANDRTHRQRQDSYRQDHLHREEQKDSSDLVSSILQVCHIYACSYIMV